MLILKAYYLLYQIFLKFNFFPILSWLLSTTNQTSNCFWYKSCDPLDYDHGWTDISEILIHPKYSTVYQHNPNVPGRGTVYDVAMLKLKDTIGQHEFFGHPQPDIVYPICLPQPGNIDTLIGQEVLTARFLETQTSTISSSDVCMNQQFLMNVFSDQMCSLSTPDLKICDYKDKGSPLMFHNKLENRYKMLII